MINTFEEKLAYEIGVKLAHQDYLKKEASMQAAKTLMGGLKGVATGQGTTMSQAFRQGAKQVEGAGATNFRGVMGEIGQGLKAPWQNLYKTYGTRAAANRAYTSQRNLNAAKRTAQENLKKVQNTQGATSEQISAAQKAVTDATAASRAGMQNLRGQYGSVSKLKAARNQSYVPRNADGTVNYGALGTMATGVGIAGAGTYMAGNAAFGGGNTYVTNQVQPQAAPHEYYLKKFFG